MKVQEEYINIQDDQPKLELEIAPKIPIPIGKTAFDVQFQINAEQLKNLECDPKVQLLMRLTKFYQYGKKIELQKHFRPRKQPKYHLSSTRSVPNQLIVYGYEFMKVKDLRAQYHLPQKKEEKQTKMRKIDDSNFKLTYQSFEQAWNAIQSNIQDPSTMKIKRQNEQIYIPNNWFQMKPYIYMEAVIQVQARFATTEDSTVQSAQEDLISSYKDSKDIFNSQQSRLREEERINIELKREKLEIRKQKNSEGLYKKYEAMNGDEWNSGKSNNPGAHREQSRSRSRDKNNKRRTENDDAQSSYSYTIRKDLKDINKQMNNFSIEEQPQVRQEELDLSYDLTGNGTTQQAGHSWKGSEISANDRKFNYREYMQRKEREEEEEKRKKLVHVVVLD